VNVVLFVVVVVVATDVLPLVPTAARPNRDWVERHAKRQKRGFGQNNRGAVPDFGADA
jgi:hypothetical protein